MSFVSELTERITIQQPSLVDDGYGGQTVSWSDFVSVFAQVAPVYANWREQDVAGQLDAAGGVSGEYSAAHGCDGGDAHCLENAHAEHSLAA